MDEFIFGTSGISYGIVTKDTLNDVCNKEIGFKDYKAYLSPLLPCAYVKKFGLNNTTSEEVYISSSYQGYPVRIISDTALNTDNTSIQKLHIPDTVKCVGWHAFQSDNLTHIKFYGELIRVQTSAIFKCSRLQSLIIPYIKSVSYPLCDSSGAKNEKWELYCEVETNTEVSKNYLLQGCSGLIEFSGRVADCTILSGDDVSKITVIGSSDYTTKSTALLNSLPNVETLVFSPECTDLNITPLFTKDSQTKKARKLKEIYINNIVKTPTDPSARFFPDNFDPEQVTIYVPWKEPKEEKDDYFFETQIIRNLTSLSNEKSSTIVFDYQPNPFDTDFIGVSFKGKHLLRDYNIYRVSKSNRYDMHLNANVKLNTATEKTFETTYFFGGNRQPLQFTLDFAFDSLTAKQLKEVRQLFSPTSIGELIFDEHPYKVYDAKVTDTPKMNFVLFGEDDEERIYKGEMTIQLTAYYPFAHTPIQTKFGVDGRYFQYYDINLYSTRSQWKKASGLIDLNEEFELGINRGEKPSPFIAKLSGSVVANTIIKVADNKITIQEACSNVEWNSKTGLVTGEVNSVRRGVRFSGQSICELPLAKEIPDKAEGETLEYIDTTGTKANLTVDYQFWYY